MIRHARGLLRVAMAALICSSGASSLSAADPATAPVPALATAHPNIFFDPDPHHPWNELYGALFIRPGRDGKLHGLDEMDPLYWWSTRYLLEQPLHAQALAVLDNFIQTKAAQSIRDPLKRALLQRMLWALFDRWSYEPSMYRGSGDLGAERRELQRRVAKIMKAVALTDAEINALPHNYEVAVGAKTYPAVFDAANEETPFLPVGLFSRADWVELDGTNYDVLAPSHVQAVSGRSAFHIFISLPGGRANTLAYLRKLHDFQPHWTNDWNKVAGFALPFTMKSEPPYLNPDIPQVPLLTKFALVRTAQLIDQEGNPVSSPLTESIQIRIIRSIEMSNSSGGKQDFFMFMLDPAKLMKGEGALVAIGPRQSVYDMVLADAVDPLEPPVQPPRIGSEMDSGGRFPRLQSCQGCHSAPGIFSMNSYIQFFQSERTLKAPDLREGDDAGWVATNWKRDQYNWGLLQVLWFEAE